MANEWRAHAVILPSAFFPTLLPSRLQFRHDFRGNLARPIQFAGA